MTTATATAHRNEYQQKRRDAMKAAGICVACHHTEATPGKTCCERCRLRQREYSLKHRQSKKLAEQQCSVASELAAGEDFDSSAVKYWHYLN